jgi:uncharacterized protein (TIGR03435 family)
MTNLQNQKTGKSKLLRNKKINFFSFTGLFLLLLAVFFNTAAAQPTKGLKVGDAAPDLRLTKLLKAPAGTKGSLNELKGKVVVLEFWATWCSPCIPAIDHLSQIATKYKDKPVQFIFVTDEDEKRASWFLQKRSPTGWIGLDENRHTIEAYQFVGIPHTVVIDSDGKIAAITSPKDVTETALNDLLSGKKISLPLKQAVAEDLEWDKDLVRDDTVFQIIIQSSNAYTGGMRISPPPPRHLTFDGAVLQAMVQTAFQMPSTRVINKLSKSQNEQGYRASVVVPKGKENLLYPTFQRALIENFSLRVHRETREMDVFLLRKIDNQNPILKPSQAKEVEYTVMRGKITVKKQPISKLADSLENFFGKPVIDETGLKENYDWNLSYTYADKNILLESLRKETSLELVPVKRMVEVLVIENELPEQ